MTIHRQPVPASDARRPLFLGIDVGGTNTKLGIVDDQGATIALRRIATQQERGPADAIKRIVAATHEMLAEHDLHLDEIAAAGLGTPGSMDIARGYILEPPNLPHWRHFPIRDHLAQMLGKPVAFANDANAAAYGEFWIGRGREFGSMVMLTLGTGVGGGIIIDGHSFDGANSFGAECGHVVVDSSPDARCCVWGGGQGQLEAYACAGAVVARTEDALEGADTSLHGRLAAGERLTPLMLYEEASQGDAFSMNIILETARYLGIAVTTLIHVIDPGLVVLGGAMDFGGPESNVGRRFLQRVREEFQQRGFNVVVEGTEIDFAILGGDAGYIGAAGLGRRLHCRETAPPVVPH